MSKLPQLYASSYFRPDVICNSEEKQKRKFLRVVEVYSSPIEETKKILFLLQWTLSVSCTIQTK